MSPAMNRVHYRSTGTERETPWWVFRALDAEFHFTVDVCATEANAKQDHFYSPELDGLAQDWSGHVCWMNPPYGRSIGAWMRKAYESSQRGATVVCLIPSRTDTAWWHDYVEGKAEVRFIRGRLQFQGNKKDAPFPSAIAIYRPEQLGR